MTVTKYLAKKNDRFQKFIFSKEKLPTTHTHTHIIVIYIMREIKPSFYYPCVAVEKVLAVEDF